jgi:ribose 5-phosphate isomerase A
MPDTATHPATGAERAKDAAAEHACTLVEDGMRLGLGTGSTAVFMLRRLGRRVREEGLRVTGVPTSRQTARLAREEGIAVVSLDETPRLDLVIDGADEADPRLDLIKGGGGALLHEKIVAAAAERVVIIADAGKAVARLGAYPLPVEVVPFGAEATRLAIRRALDELGYRDAAIATRNDGELPYSSDEGNLILDLHLEAIEDAAALDAALRAIPGLVETGLFLGMADLLVLGHEDGQVELRERRD